MTGNEIHTTEKLAALRKRAGFSMQKIAQKMGYKGQSSYQRYEDPTYIKKDFLPSNIIAKLIDALEGQGTPPIKREEILELGGPVVVQLARDAHQPTPKPDEAIDVNLLATPGKKIPVFGSVRGGDDDVFEFNGNVIDKVFCPPAMEGVQDAYAVYVVGESMEPRYFAGELLFIHPGRIPTKNCFVVVQLKNGTDGTHHSAMIKQFRSWNNDSLKLRQFNPDKDFEIPTEKIYAVHRVVMSSEG